MLFPHYVAYQTSEGGDPPLRQGKVTCHASSYLMYHCAIKSRVNFLMDRRLDIVRLSFTLRPPCPLAYTAPRGRIMRGWGVVTNGEESHGAWVQLWDKSLSRPHRQVIERGIGLICTVQPAVVKPQTMLSFVEGVAQT